MQKFDVEMTDVFCGEANYCWVKRHTVELPDNATDRSLVIAAKKALGITGAKTHRRLDTGDMLQFDLVGCHIRVFITPVI